MNKNIILVIVSFAMFMEAVDTTIINTAIPVMATSLSVNPLNLKLALISYLLSLAIFIPISGWIADKYGTKKVFLTAVTVFTLSSVWCGFTQNLWELIAARVIQGLGGSLTVPIGRLIILRTCQRHELISKMNIVIMVASLGMMLGPLLGGIITDHFSWRWIFWVNIPVGLLTVLLGYKLLPEMPATPVHPLDKTGFLLFGSGLAFLTFSLSSFSESDIGIMQSLSTLIVAFGLLLAYQQHSQNKPFPIVKVALLTIRTFRVSVIGNLLARLGFGGIPFLVPLFLQLTLGFSPKLSGLLLAPVALGVFLVKPLSIYILRAFGYKNLLIINTMLVSFSLCAFATITPNTPIYIIGCFTFIYGFLIALQYTGMNSLAYANMDDDNISAATSIMSTIQQLSQSFGVAVSAIFISMYSYQYSSNHVLTITIFHYTFYSLGLLTFLSGLIFFQLKREDGEELIAPPRG